MKQSKWRLCGAALAIGVLSGALGADEGARRDWPGTPRTQPAERIRGEYSMFAKEANLTDAQKAKEEDRVKEYNAALAKWNEANGAKLKELQTAVDEGRKNSTDITAAMEQYKILNSAKEKLDNDLWTDLRSMVAPEQWAQWESFKLYREAKGRFRDVEFSDDQIQQIRALTDAAAKTMPSLTGREPEAAKAELYRKIEKLLTPEQREARKAAQSRPAGPRGDRGPSTRPS